MNEVDTLIDVQRSFVGLRASLAFTFRALDLKLDGSRLFDHLLLLVILQRTEASSESPSSISIRSVADGLHLPHETARRHISKLLDAHILRRHANGVVVAPGADIWDDYRRALDQIVLDLDPLLASIDAAPLLLAGDAVERTFVAGAESRPRAAHTAFDYALRTIDMLVEHGDNAHDGLIFGAILLGNFDAMSDGDLLAADKAGGFNWQRAALKPVQIGSIAATLGLSRSSVRRRTHRWLAGGRYVAGDGGLVISEQELTSPSFTDLMTKSRASITRLQNDLRRLAVQTQAHR